jgi:hypothetical protein
MIKIQEVLFGGQLAGGIPAYVVEEGWGIRIEKD